jgi:hypothetical protein
MASVRIPILTAPLMLRAKGLVSWFRLGPMLTRLANANITISVDGLDIQQIHGGVHITNPANAGEYCKVPCPPATGNYVLTSEDGVMEWEEITNC